MSVSLDTLSYNLLEVACRAMCTGEKDIAFIASPYPYMLQCSNLYKYM